MATGTNAIATRTNANSKKSGAYTSDLSRCVTQRSAFSAGFSGFVTTEDWGTWTLSYNKVNTITPNPQLTTTANGRIFTLRTITGTGTDGSVASNSINLSITFKNPTQVSLTTTNRTVYVVVRVMAGSTVIASKSTSVQFTSGRLAASQSITKTSTVTIPSFSFSGDTVISRVEVCIYNGTLGIESTGTATWAVTASTTASCNIKHFEGQRLVKYSNL